MPLVRPLSCAIALALGIALAPALDRMGWPEPARWLAVLALGVLATRRRELIVVAVLALGAARGAVPQGPAPAHVDDRELDRITGVVAGPVARTRRGTGALVETAADPVWVWAGEALVPGERIAVTGYLTSPRGPRGPGLPDRATALRARGARFELAARSIERLGDHPDALARAWRWAARVQARGSAAIARAGGDPTGSAALRGIALGDRADVPPELDERWRRCGIYHVLSVSGLHLGIVALLCFRLLRAAIAASPWGGRTHPARWAGPPTLAIAIAYTLVTGGQLATLRATIVVAIVVAGAMLDRPVRFVDALGATAIVLLAWRPADLFDPGFQLSFVAALTLALRPDRAGRGLVRRWIVRPVVVSIWIGITTAPITAYHFQEVTVGGVLGNVVFTPVLELLALPLALGGLVASWDAPVWLAAWLVGIVDRLCEPVAQVMPVGRIAVASPVVLAVLVALSVGLAARRRRTRLDALAWLALCAAWALGRAPPPADALRVTFVDVGQGDAAIVELPGGEVWLIDAGGHAHARDPAAAAAPGRTIGRILAAYGHDRIDVAIVSHPHPDHYQGLAALELPIDELWFAPDEDDGAFAALARTLAARGTRLVHPPLGLARARDGVELIALAPRYQAADGAPVVLAADPVRSVNDNSLAVAIRYRDRTLLFTGDLEHEGEELLVASGLGRVDVVKVPHHGSPTSSTAALVAATRPAVAVISCGRANPFRFPARAVVERWRSAGAEIARTDTDGTITIVVDADGDLTVDRHVDRASE